jgi:hypothetical protein
MSDKMFNCKNPVDLVLHAGRVGRRAALALIGSVAFATRCVWMATMTALKRPSRSAHEKFLEESIDRFEVEQRERAWNRWQSEDGSLLGH